MEAGQTIGCNILSRLVEVVLLAGVVDADEINYPVICVKNSVMQKEVYYANVIGGGICKYYILFYPC